MFKPCFTCSLTIYIFERNELYFKKYSLHYFTTLQLTVEMRE